VHRLQVERRGLMKDSRQVSGGVSFFLAARILKGRLPPAPASIPVALPVDDKEGCSVEKRSSVLLPAALDPTDWRSSSVTNPRARKAAVISLRSLAFVEICA
jgi:hypothetical protein